MRRIRDGDAAICNDALARVPTEWCAVISRALVGDQLPNVSDSEVDVVAQADEAEDVKEDNIGLAGG